MTPPFNAMLGSVVPKALDLGKDGVSHHWMIQQATIKFVELFLQELRDRGVEAQEIEQKKYQEYLNKLVSDRDTQELLAKSFESSFGFDCHEIDRLEQIWTQKYQPSGVPFPADFDWDLLMERYQLVVMELRAGDEKEREVILIEATEDNHNGQKSIAPIPVGFDLSEYRKSLQSSYGSLKLNTLDPTDRQDRIELRKMFTLQNVREAIPPSRFEIPQDYKQALSTPGQLDRDLKIEQVEQYRRQYLEKSVEPVLTAIGLENCQRAVVLGDPGSGKSTLLQYLALEWAEGKTERFPLLIELREYVNDRDPGKTFLDFLERDPRADWQFDRHKLHEYLCTQPSLVMFDGLDEIFDSPKERLHDRQDYEAVVDEIANFATQQYPNAKIIVTSRVIGYSFLEYFCATEIVHQFESECSLSLEQLQDDIFGQHWQDKPWHEVLKLICGLLEPKWAGELVEFLMEREVDRSDCLDDNKRANEAAFQHLQLARECLAEVKSPQSISSIAAKLQEKLKNEIESQSGILISHKAALSLFNSIGKYDRTSSETLTWLQNFAAIHSQDLVIRRAAVESIGKYDRTSSETLTWLQNFAAIHSQDLVVRRAAVESIGKYYHTSSETLTWLQNIATLDSQDRWVRGAAVESIGKYYHTEPETLTWLQNIATLDSQERWVRGAAVESIGKYYHTEPETLTWLQNIALHDEDLVVRRAAVESIGKYYHTSAETPTWLQNIALHDEDLVVRRAAVESIGKYYHTEPETLTWLQNIALHDEYGWVRQAAVESIGKYYIQSDGIFEVFCQIASVDPYQGFHYHNPRKTALEALVEHYIDRSGLIELLRDRSTQDPDEELRKWAEERLKNIV